MGKFVCLEKSPLTKDWSQEERAALAHFLTAKVVPPGAFVEEVRSKSRCLYFIDSGSVTAKFENIEVILKEGETFGELSLSQANAKMCSIVSNATPGTNEGVKLWCLEFAQWTKLKIATPIVAEKLASCISAKLAQLLNSSPPPPRLFQVASSTTGPSSHHS